MLSVGEKIEILGFLICFLNTHLLPTVQGALKDKLGPTVEYLTDVYS